MYRLQFLNGKFKGKRLNIQQGSLTIGRDPSNNVDLEDDDEVSRHHAVIEYRGGSPIIRDLGSINTVQVNDIRVKEHRLRHGDRIEIGRTVIEFMLGSSKKGSLEKKHRFSKLQALSFLSIGLIVLLQILFVFLFPLWQSRSVVPIDESLGREVVLEEPVPVEVAEADKLAEGTTEDVPDAASEPIVADDVEDADSVMDDIAALEAKFNEPDDALVEAAEERAEQFEDPLAQQAEEMVRDAAAEAARGELGRADNILERALMIHPDFIPAIEARAKLFEQRGMLREADAQWGKIMELAAGTVLFDTASSERQRIARQTFTPPKAQEPPEVEVELPTYKTTRNLEKRLRIHSVERERFQGTDDFDEMRIVRISLRPSNDEGDIDSSAVRVVVHFYDRLEGSSRSMLTRALVAREAIRITGEWPAAESRRVTATYILNKGFRDKEFEEIGEKRTYDGFRVSLYYEGKLQDEYAMPRRLAELPMPPKPEI